MALDDPMDKLEELEAVSGTKVLQMSCAKTVSSVRRRALLFCFDRTCPHRASVSGCRAASIAAAWGTALATAQSCRATTRRRSAGRKTTLVPAALAARCNAEFVLYRVSNIADCCFVLDIGSCGCGLCLMQGCLTVSSLHASQSKMAARSTGTDVSTKHC